MLIEIILFLILGILAGTLTGLTPGIHTNLIGAILISISTIFFVNPIYALVFITSLAITSTFVDFIPSIFLGCPDTETELSILPGHELLKEKKGYEAIQLANFGCLSGILSLLILFFPLIFLIEKLNSTPKMDQLFTNFNCGCWMSKNGGNI